MPEITRETAENAGCWIEGHWGQYGTARLVDIAEAYGYDNAQDIDIARKHLASMGPSTSEDLTDDEFEHLMECTRDVEQWLNDNVAPEGYSFGWSSGEFFLLNDSEWEEME